jgi:hypothetical protein
MRRPAVTTRFLAILYLCFSCVTTDKPLFAGEKANNPSLLRIEARDCDCLARGRNWRQGEEICLNGRLHVCGMDQNVSSWIGKDKSCPSA